MTRPLALGLGLILLLAVWAVHVAPAGAAPTTPVCPNPPGSPCQAFFQVNAASGAVSAAIPLMGLNKEKADYDGVECRGAGSGQCFLAADRTGFSLLNLNAFNCDPSANETPIGTTPPTITVVGLAYDTHDSTLYTVSDAGQLYKVNTTTGAITAVGLGGLQVTSNPITSIAYDAASNTIYLAQDPGNVAYKLTRVDPATGKADGSFGTLQLKLDGVGNNEILGMAAVGSTLYASTANAGDGNPYLATINTASGSVTDIGSMKVDYVGGLAADAVGKLYAIAGTRGAVITPFPCPSSPGPSPSTPGPSPTTPGPSPSTPGPSPSTPGPSPSTPGPTPSTPAPSPSSILPTQFTKTPSPGTSVLGLSVSRKPILPVTGSNSLPLVLFAGICYLLGAVALKVASRRKPVTGSPEDRD